jgi:hypothetical protein
VKESILLKDINPFPQANTPGTTILTLPVGRIHGIEIIGSVAAAKAAAGFGDTRFMVGGNQQRLSTFDELSEVFNLYGAEFAMLNNVNGGPFRAFYPFTENWRKQYTAAERFAFDNPGDDKGNALRDAQLEIDFKNTAAAKTLRFLAHVEPLNEVTDQQAHNAFVKWFRKSYPVAADELVIRDLPKKDVYQRIDLYDPSDAAIETVKIKINGKYRFERDKADLDEDLSRWGMNPVEGVFSIVPDFMDNTSDGWDARQFKDFEIEVYLDAESDGAVKCITHRFGTPE